MAFIRKKTVKGREYYYIVKSYWRDGRTHQKVTYLGKNPDPDPEELKRLGIRKLTNKFKNNKKSSKEKLGIRKVSNKFKSNTEKTPDERLGIRINYDRHEEIRRQELMAYRELIRESGWG